MSTIENEESSKTRVGTLLRRIDLLLEEGKWQEALARCSDVLDIDPECADAYIAQLMAEVHAKNQEGLGAIALDYTAHQTYKNALRFSDDERANELKILAESAVSLHGIKRKRIRMAIAALVICVIAVVAVIAVQTAVANDNPVQKVRNAQIGDIVEYGSYEQDGDESNGAESLEWIVLDRTDEGTLLVTKYVIDGKPYDEGSYGVTRWDTSTLRAWLNGEFLDGTFTSEEREALLQKHTYVQVENPFESGYYYPDLDVWDTVFLLETEDIRQKYFTMVYPVDVTPYAKENGAHYDEDSSGAWWWVELTSFYDGEPSDRHVITRDYSYQGPDGDLFTWFQKDTVDGVRPAIWVASAEFLASEKQS